MLSGGYKSVLEARTREEFRGGILRFTRSLGFETVTALAVIDRLLRAEKSPARRLELRRARLALPVTPRTRNCH